MGFLAHFLLAGERKRYATCNGNTCRRGKVVVNQHKSYCLHSFTPNTHQVGAKSYMVILSVFVDNFR